MAPCPIRESSARVAADRNLVILTRTASQQTILRIRAAKRVVQDAPVFEVVLCNVNNFAL
jgi:hypothetical protein